MLDTDKMHEHLLELGGTYMLNHAGAAFYRENWPGRRPCI